MFATVLTTITTIWRPGLRIAQQKALLKKLIKTFLQKCILRADAAFMDFAVEAKCCKKSSVKKKFQTNR